MAASSHSMRRWRTSHHVDGVMLGRAAYQSPELLLRVDPLLFGEPAPVADAFEAVEAFTPYMARAFSAACGCTT